MHIYWYGQTSIKIQDNNTTIAINPYKTAKAKSPRMAADILLLTSKDLQSASSSVSGDKFIIDSPGEYEVKEVFVNGVASEDKEQTLYLLDINGITVAHLGDSRKISLTDQQLELFENVDILLVPVGEDSKISAKLVGQIEPKIVIPFFYKDSKINDKLDTIENFKKQIGIKEEVLDKLVIKQKDIPQDQMKMFVLKMQN